VQIKYATQQLRYPVWGMSPSSTADDTGNYGGFGVEGLAFPYYGTGADASHPNDGLSQCHGCATEDVVTPHASFLALDVAPQQAYANIQALRTRYPGVYGADGFFDAVSPTTGAIGHRDLVLDQSMIMASLDNALNDRAIQREGRAPDFGGVDRVYDELMALGLRPVVELSFMPRDLARDPGQTVFSYGAIISPPRDWDRWGELVGALAAHLELVP